MSDITLSPINSGYNLSTINDNFDKVETVVNNELLHTTGGNNEMGQPINMNGYDLMNGGDANFTGLVVNGIAYDELVDSAITQGKVELDAYTLVKEGELDAHAAALQVPIDAAVVDAEAARDAAQLSEANAATSESNAASSASSASTSASNASTSESNAAASEASALTSRNDTEGLYDSFRGVYYGELASDPALDPVGNPVGEGDIYWNTASSVLRLYNGTLWQDAVLNTGALGTAATADVGSGASNVPSISIADARYLLESNNLSDLTNAATAFDNIKQQATTSSIGAAAIATASQVQVGADNSKIVTPSGLNACTATETRRGVVRSATTVEMSAGTANTFPDSSKVKAYLESLGVGSYEVRATASTLNSSAWEKTDIPSWAKRLVFSATELLSSGSGQVFIQCGSTSYPATGHYSRATSLLDSDAIGTTVTQNDDKFFLSVGTVFGSPSKEVKIIMDLVDSTNNIWSVNAVMHAGSANSGTMYQSVGTINLGSGNKLGRLKFTHDSLNFSGGNLYLVAS